MLNMETECTSVLVGKKATIDGSTLIARNDDTALSIMPVKFVVRPASKSPNIVKSNLNKFEITIPKDAYRYQAVPRVDEQQYGVYEESGFNEKNVAMSATESTYSNEKVLAYDDLVSDGLDEDSIVQAVLPYIDSAREGVTRLGQLIERYGSPAGNSVLFSDQTEVWYMEIVSGHLWLAQRIPDDAYAVTANQISIQNVDFTDVDNFIWAANIRKFVEKYQLNPDRDQWNLRHIFGTNTEKDRHYNTPRVWYGHKILNPEIEENPESDELPFICRTNHLISIEDVTAILGSHYNETIYDPLNRKNGRDRLKYRSISVNRTQSSHVLQLRTNCPKGIQAMIWLSLGYPAFAPFVPFYANMKDTPESYRNTPMIWEFGSAYWMYRTLSVLVEKQYSTVSQQDAEYLKKVQKIQRKFIETTDVVAQRLSGDLLTQFLTAKNAELVQKVDAQTKKFIGELVIAGIKNSDMTFDLSQIK